MFSVVRRRLSYANVVATFALVFAMSGGALAASKYLITSSKQIKPSVFASLKGKAGANGAQGPAGAAGPQGPSGPTGAQGPAGTKGEAGPEGKEGKEGKVGKAGLPGEPWTVGGTLPEGKTETGTWSFGPSEEPGLDAEEPIEVASFPIPLKEPLPNKRAHLILKNGMEEVESEEVVPTACGSAIGPEVNASNPQAKPGNLCVYLVELTGLSTESNAIKDPATGGFGNVGRTGAIMETGITFEGTQRADGTWAVTAE
jgi:hypothetical protein